MASRRNTASRAFRRATAAPSRSVLYSLVAFLIVAACPFIITQFEDVDNGLLIDHYVSGDDISLFLYNSGSQISFSDYSAYFVDSGNDILGFIEYTGASDVNAYTFKYIIPEGTDYDNIAQLRFSCNLPVITNCVFNADSIGSSVPFQLSDDGYYFAEFDTLDSYKMDFASYVTITVAVPAGSVVSEFDISIDVLTAVDDYSGTIVCFASGVMLLIIALIISPVFNPMRRR